jgi:ribose transport system substrate-binding protein
MKFFKNFIVFLHKCSIPILIILISITSLAIFWLNEGHDAEAFFSQPKYHFYFIAQNSGDPFWDEVLKGAQQSAKDNNVAVEFYEPRFDNPNEELKYIDIATICKVDGIITHATNDPQFTSAINKAYDKNIPVITFKNDNNSSKRQAFIGMDSFGIGSNAAKLLIKATGGKANIAVISSEDSNQGSVEQSLEMSGFMSTLKNYPEMKIVNNYNSKLGTLSAEEITQQIINSKEDINAIFTDNSGDTLGVAQFIVNNYAVGSITLVGYGDSPEILNYIDSGIIYGTVSSDAYKMGYESVTSLIDLKEKKSVPIFIESKIETITEENINKYKTKH